MRLLVIEKEVAFFVKLCDKRPLVGHKRYGFGRVAELRLHRAVADNGVLELCVGIHMLVSAKQSHVCGFDQTGKPLMHLLAEAVDRRSFLRSIGARHRCFGR